MEMLALFDSLVAAASGADKPERERLKRLWRELMRGQQQMISAMNDYFLDEPINKPSSKIN